MKAAEKASKGGEISMSEKQSANGGEVIVEVQNVGTYEGKGSPSTKQSKVNLGVSTESSSTRFGGFPSPDVSRASPNPGKPPRAPARNESINRRKSFNRSVISKPKSRFGEPSPVMNEDGSLDQVGASSPYRTSLNRGSPYNLSGRATSISSAKNASSSPGRTKENEDEEIYKKVKLSKNKRGKVNKKLLVELIALLCILSCVLASLTVRELRHSMVWELEIWKWCVLVMVIFSGMLVTNWVMHLIVFLIECNFLLRKKVLYFVHGMKKSVQVFLWLCLVLFTWLLLFNRGVKRSKTSTKILSYVTWTIVSVLIGAFLWLLKTLLLKILASSFHVNTFFDRIQESIFHQYVLQTLSGHPLMEEGDGNGGRSPSTSKLSYRATKKAKAGKEKEVIDMTKLQKIKQEKVSSWTMKVLVDAVTSSGLSTISHTLDGIEGNEQRDKEITSEMEATAAAYDIFFNVAAPGAKYIEEWELSRFMIEEEVDLVWPLIDVTKTGRVDRNTLTEWVVKVFNGRKALAHSLTDTKTAVKQLNKLVTAILVIITTVVWLLLVEIATTKVLVFLSSQLVVAAFMFGNTCKTIFEAIIFVFVMHPFDVGDRCVVEGVELMVEEMNILTTVFLKLNQEKVYYPNSVLSTKPISNYYRSSDMGDIVEFSIAFTTPVEKIGLLKEKVKQYVEGNSTLWHPNHAVVVLEIENMNKLKMALYFRHTMNFQEWVEKQKRRTEMVIALKNCFDELQITYYLLPLEVRLTETNVTKK
ncbi:mechanosensitive ion channel protein 10 [Rosa sericea]